MGSQAAWETRVNRSSLLGAAAGSMVASLVRPPAYAQASKTLRYGMAPAEDSALGKPVQIFGTIATKAFVDANPDVVSRAAGALRLAAKWANDPRNHSEAAVIISSFTKIDPAYVNAYPRLHFAEKLDVSFVQPPIDMLAKYGFLSRDFPATELFATIPGYQA